MSSDKTEKATPKRLRDLRHKGVVARSADLPVAVGLFALAVALPGVARRLGESLEQTMQLGLSSAGTSDVTQARHFSMEAAASGAKALAPLLLMVGAATLLANVLVTRSRPNPFALRPRVDNLSPKKGVKRIFGVHNLVDTGKMAVKLTLVALASWSGLATVQASLLGSGGKLDVLVAVVGRSALSVLMRVALLTLVVGVADAWWSRKKFNKSAKMTKQEIRDEHKLTEGNPHTKGAIRARQRKLARVRMIQSVRSSDVVLANPTHYAVALRYEPGVAAPIVVAKGAGAIAQRIKAEAAAHEVPIVENKPLTRALWRACEVGDVIPADFYEAVARVLAVVFAARKKMRRSA